MTRQVLFIQGGGEGTHDSWDNRLVVSLARELGDGYALRYPRMPDEGDPQYSTWKAALLDELGALDAGAILVGHSIGGAILINVLAKEQPDVHFAGLFLIAAPFIGEGGWPDDDVDDLRRVSSRLPHGTPVYLYHGTADDEVPTDHVRLYADAVPRAVVRLLEGRDHQLGDDLSEVALDIRSLG